LNSDPTTSKDLQSDSAGGPQRAWISLGGNIPWRGMIGAPLFEAALRELGQGGFQITATSRLWTGPAWPDPSDPPFFNAVAEGLWPCDAEGLMALLLRTEIEFGRARGLKNAPRTLDLDLLDMEWATGAFPSGLELPHRRIAGRAFILAPLADAGPGWRDRFSGRSATEILKGVENKEDFNPVSATALAYQVNSPKT
jgi:2-amino-4-hydroxy-6-hydroxymethyldihydropteridine diphosphokinase